MTLRGACSRTLPTSRASFSRRRAGCTRTVTSPSSSTSSARSRRHLPRTTRRISDRIFCQRTAPRPRLAQALGLAAALGRTLILPPVTCGYDKAWYALDKSGAFGGAPSWVVPIRNCPLDHYIESGELVRRRGGGAAPAALGGHVREWSLLANPRTPPAVLASAAEVEVGSKGGPWGVGGKIAPDGGAQELQRLRREFGSAKVLLVANLPQHDLWKSGLLGDEVRRELATRFPYVSGSWCCAPDADKKRGMPNSHSFHLPIPKPGETRRRDEQEPLFARAREEALFDGGGEETSVVEG
jgi:hypothetical protein